MEISTKLKIKKEKIKKFFLNLKSCKSLWKSLTKAKKKYVEISVELLKKKIKKMFDKKK